MFPEFTCDVRISLAPNTVPRLSKTRFFFFSLDNTIDETGCCWGRSCQSCQYFVKPIKTMVVLFTGIESLPIQTGFGISAFWAFSINEVIYLQCVLVSVAVFPFKYHLLPYCHFGVVSSARSVEFSGSGFDLCARCGHFPFVGRQIVVRHIYVCNLARRASCIKPSKK